MEKRYDSGTEELKWQKYWKDNNIFRFNPDMDSEIYSVDTPPPTISGKMHIGHFFSYAQQDFVVRYKRMRGFNVFYPFGTDDNGLPTKLLIEKEKKVKASMMDRKEFTALCLKTLETELQPKYVAEWERMGMSCDFDMYYTTINEHCQRISQKSFIDLYNLGREYRAEAAAMYCPRCQTAISQVECEDKLLDSHFNDVVFKVDSEDLIIATTRPELLPACVGIFYHPDDARYQKYEGKTAKVPLFDLEVPILTDKDVDPEKGTGIMMCCTFGDAMDADWQKAYNLPIREAIGKDGRMTDLAGRYAGEKITDARLLIIEDLKNEKKLVKQEPIQHAVNVHERCQTPVEFIHSKQWFIKYLDKKDEMLEWGKQLNWYPSHMKNRYDNWVKGLRWDWCISRQLPFGIPFPVWYCKKCDETILAIEKDLPVDPLSDKPPISQCPKCRSREFIPEKDILNTWATSSLTPQIAASLVPEMYDKLYPMSLRPQAHDIISFWLFNTVVKSQLHNKVNPWQDVMISGWALDPKGKKMSKSRGNVVDPDKMLEKYCADSLRFWAAGSKLGEDLAFQEKDLVTGDKFITKLWNATRFALMHLDDYDLSDAKLELMDRWILSKLNRLIRSSIESFDRCEYSRTKAETENFFWHSLCDNYLEIVKDRLYNPERRGKEQRKAAQYSLYHLFLSCLKLIAPIMPYITEAIYHEYFAEKDGSKSIHLSSWPECNGSVIDEDLEKTGDAIVELIGVVRRYKSDKNLSLKTLVKKLTIECSAELKGQFEDAVEDIKSTTTSELVEFGDGELDVIDGVKIKIEL